jgi:beta-1,4-mannosyl-glycoprotein beta-1,4-N-acetylglucosaminyltransferase
MKIIDCFNIYNEKELLWLRLDYLYNTVDKFVIVESLDSHSKQLRKEKYMFEEHAELYKPYMDKIIFLKIDVLPSQIGDMGLTSTKWINENYQKNYCQKGLVGLNLKPTDWIMFSDIDEIPNKDLIANLRSIRLKRRHRYIQFHQKLFYYYVNVVQRQIWGGTVATQYQHFRSMMDMRERREQQDHICLPLDNAGWHYSYCGGPERILEKMQSYAEWKDNKQWCNIGNIESAMETNKDILGREDEIFIKTTVDIFSDPALAPSNIKAVIERFPYLLKG